ncbi:MAG TPA: hypothetical protein ENH20_00045 [Candidatus Pacearchaeota archaeon]|nr:hypothetical protein [Candidatus Pacearchaeota archaeon]
MKKISKIVEVKCFCHGAMCVAASGRRWMRGVCDSEANINLLT